MTALKVVSITRIRELKQAEAQESSYRFRVLSMDKLALLNEMVAFQEERTRAGQLTPSMMIRGRVLFAALEKNADSEPLRLLTRSYRRHLEHELKHFVGEAPQSSAPQI